MPRAMLDAVVVGAGQAGLGVSFYLKEAGIEHLVLERGRIGESWLSQRWDGFHMNTINAQTVMPGQRYDGPDPEGFTTHRGWVALLEAFARANGLPVETGLAVIGVEATEGGFRLRTPRNELRVRNLVLASGGQNRPRRPGMGHGLSPRVLQLHSAEYRNPAALPDGAVLVAGAGQSGCQIAEELLRAGRRVYLSTCRVGRFPRRYRGRDMIVWLHEAGIMDRGPEQLKDPLSMVRGQPQIGPWRTLSLQSLSAEGVVLLGRLAGVEDDTLHIAGDLAENMRAADAASEEMKREVDAHIARAGLDVPPAEPDPHETVAPKLPDPPIRSLRLSAKEISSVIWATGFDGEFDWLRIPGSLDAQGRPTHVQGVAAHPGLFFTGLPWLTTRRSALVTGVEVDGRRIAGLVAARMRA